MNNALIDVLNGLPTDVRDSILKAAETVATSTFSPATRSVFSPENLSEDIKLLVPIDTPLRNKLPRVKGFGQAAAWKKLTSKLHSKINTTAGGVGTNTDISFADAGAPGETSQTYSVTSAAYKLLGRKVEVGGLANAASAGRGLTMLDEREKVKIYETFLGEEELLIGGDSAEDTNEFDGILKQVTTNSGSASLLTASGIGVYATTLADTYGAYPTDLFAAGRQIRALADELQGSGSIQRIVVDNQGRGIGGVSLASIINPVNGTPIAVNHDRYMNNNALLLTLRSPAGEAWIEVDELIPLSRIDVPSSNFSYIRFVLEALVLKVIGEPFQYKITGLAVS